MTTTPLTSQSSTAALGASSSASSSSSGGLNSLNTGDFIKMMLTQLQNQDPLQPESNDQLMSQMSQIGQLQSNSQLQTTLTTFAQQTQIGAASSLMGKKVQGLDANSNPVNGVVTGVQVSTSGVNLNLDSGGILPMSNVTSIGPAPGSAATMAAA